MIAATRKVHFASFFSPPLGGDGVCVRAGYWHTPVIADRDRMGRDLGTFNAPVLTTAFNSAQISLLVFLYRDFGEQIEDPRMFDVTS